MRSWRRRSFCSYRNIRHPEPASTELSRALRFQYAKNLEFGDFAISRRLCQDLVKVGVETFRGLDIRLNLDTLEC